MATVSWAQSNVYGAIGGTVTDPSEGLVPGATITVTSVGTNRQVTGTSDSVGRYVIVNLTPGVYTVEINASGFAKYRLENVYVEVGRTTTVAVKLGLAAQETTVVATAETPVITADRPDVTTNINELAMDNLPLARRRWSTLALTSPGTTPDGSFGLISFRGISGLLNNNTVDGGDNNQAFFAEEKGRTRINYSVSQSSIREFQVNTSNYSAEFGRSAGGVVNAVTKSGENAFHGEAFWYYNSSDFAAFSPFQQATVPNGSGGFTTVPIKPADKRHQFGGNLGGPIVKDRLFWFFNADAQKRNFPGVANASNPSCFFSPLTAAANPSDPCNTTNETATLTGRGITAAQANSALSFLQSLTGVVPRRGDETVIFPKIDWNITGNQHFSVQWNRMRWNSPAGIQTGAVVFRGRESFGDDFVKADTVVTRLTSTITPTIINEFRFTFGRDFEFQFGQSAIPGQPVSSLGVSPQIGISGNAGITFGYPNFLDRAAYPEETNYQFSDSISWSRGKHLFKFGEDINRVHDVLSNLFQQYGAYSYSNRVQFISDYVASVNSFAQPVCGTVSARTGCWSSFNQGFGPLSFEFTTVDYGLFVQDDWRVLSRLTLNLGLRWEYQQLPKPQIPNPLLPPTNDFPSDRNNFGPRIGAAWDITGQHKVVLRGGYGIYYGRIINSTISNAITNTAVSGAQVQLSMSSAAASGAPLYPNVLSSGGAAGADVVVFEKDTPNPTIHQFDAVLEYAIATNTAVSISYIGSLGRNLPRFIDANLPPPASTITYTVSGGPDDGSTYTVPLFSGTRPNTSFGRITTISNSVKSKYNALVLQFNRRMTGGLQVQSSYTYSNTSDVGQTSQTFTSSNNMLNPYDLELEQGRSNFDIRHRFVASAIWQPPYFDRRGTLMKQLLGGFTISPIITAASGAPHTGFISGNPPSGISRIQTGILGAGGTNRPPWIPRNAFQMPKTVNIDLRIAKRFPVYERVDFEVFGQAFNLFNHVNVTSVGTTLYSLGGTAAKPTLTYQTNFQVPTNSSSFFSNPRQIEIGARLTF